MLFLNNSQYNSPMVTPTLSVKATPYDGISTLSSSPSTLTSASSRFSSSSASINPIYPNNDNTLSSSKSFATYSYSSACGSNRSKMTATTASCSSAVNTIDNAKIRKQHQSLPQCHPRGLQPQSPLPPRYPYTQPQRSQAYQSINTHSHNNATATTSSSSGSSSGTSTKVKPYRFRDEPQKKIIVKTELCRAILEGKPCRFGSKCNFAHHENELKYKTLVERHDAGLIDKETYRTRPCLDHIMVGDWYVYFHVFICMCKFLYLHF